MRSKEIKGSCGEGVWGGDEKYSVSLSVNTAGYHAAMYQLFVPFFPHVLLILIKARVRFEAGSVYKPGQLSTE